MWDELCSLRSSAVKVMDLWLFSMDEGGTYWDIVHHPVVISFLLFFVSNSRKDPQVIVWISPIFMLGVVGWGLVVLVVFFFRNAEWRRWLSFLVCGDWRVGVVVEECDEWGYRNIGEVWFGSMVVVLLMMDGWSPWNLSWEVSCG